MENEFQHIKMQSHIDMSNIDFYYSIDNNISSRVTEFNDLGVTITTNLSWCENVKTVSVKTHSRIGIINSCVGFEAPFDTSIIFGS